MGRHAGLSPPARHWPSAMRNFVLIPESDFDMDGAHGFLATLEQRILERKHAVIVVAEGAGQKYCTGEGTDESGNPRFGDIGIFLKDAIAAYFKARGLELNLKYIDPSYTIRSEEATADDAIFCTFLAANAGTRGKWPAKPHGGWVVERRVCVHSHRPGSSRPQAG